MRRTVWETRHVPDQRGLFVLVWSTHVKNQLAALGRLRGSTVLQADIALVEAFRVAAVFASAWMDAPERLARDIDPVDDSAPNRAAVAAALALAGADEEWPLPLGLLGEWEILVQGLDPSKAEQLRARVDVAWAERTRRLRLHGTVSPVAARTAFRAVAAENGLTLDDGRPERPWLPRNIQNWFGPGSRMASEAIQEKRHAVVDAFFLDAYRRHHAASTVTLLATFPKSDLVTPPDRSLRTAAYERECAARHREWLHLFAHELQLGGYPEVTLVLEELDRLRRAEARPTTTLPTPTVAELLRSWVAGLDLAPEALAAACQRAQDVLGAVTGAAAGAETGAETGADRVRAAARAVLAWLGHAAPEDAPFPAVAHLDPHELLLVVTMCHHALTGELPPTDGAS